MIEALRELKEGESTDVNLYLNDMYALRKTLEETERFRRNCEEVTPMIVINSNDFL